MTASPTSVAVTGRFQPVHNDHLGLFLHGLSLADRLIVAITNPDPRSWQSAATSQHRHLATSNPFSFFERQQMVIAALETAGVAPERFRVVPFPLDAPEVWHCYVSAATSQLVRAYSDWERDKAERLAAAGYPVTVLDGDPTTRVSATDVRTAMASSEPWSQWVPGGTRDVLTRIGEDELKRRCRDGLC